MANVVLFVLFLCGAGIAGCIFMYFRNDWVYRERVRLLEDCHELYMMLPDYETMLYRFWVFDIRKFIKKED